MRMGRGMMPASTASAEDVEGGARLILRPEDPSRLEPLREHVRMKAERMAQGGCPMMELGSGAVPTTAPPGSGDAAHEGDHPQSPGK
jgi:hypothetical protein